MPIIVNYAHVHHHGKPILKKKISDKGDEQDKGVGGDTACRYKYLPLLKSLEQNKVFHYSFILKVMINNMKKKIIMLTFEKRF